MNRHGFATLVAIVLIALVAMAAVAISSRFAADARRTRDARADAQLRQMLLAGAHAATAKTGRWDGGVVVAVPAELGGQVKITVTPRGDEAVILIEADLDGRTMRQELAWARTAGQWTLRSAVLNP